MKTTLLISSVFSIAFLFSCQQNEKPVSASDPKVELPERVKPKTFGYQVKDVKLWLQDSTVEPAQREIVYAVNRTDKSNFAKMDSVIIPVDLSGDLVYYLPFPLKISSLKEVDKIVFFSYATQAFAAYEYGVLVRTGPTNMGREDDQTPTGLFFTNWKAKKTTSTFNDEWELKWNFNIANKAGVGWHQYTLPGYPASHSCLRLQEEDAKYLFDWAEQWVLENKNKILVKGIPVIVFGSYDFHAPKPWLQLLNDPHALDISESTLENEAQQYLGEILSEQKKRMDYNANPE